MIYFTLFYEFFKIGLFAIGGGLATIPFLFELTTKYNWFTQQNLTDMIAISESTPGPIGVNMATYAGFHTAGIAGGIIATLGLVTPSIIVIILVSKVLERFKESQLVQQVFYGLRPAVAGLIIAAAAQLFQIAMVNSSGGSWMEVLQWKSLILFVLLTIATYKIKIHPIFYILIGAVLGIVFQLQ